MVSANDGVVTPVRTGYEQVIADRCDNRFAFSAPQAGKVTKVTKDAVSVQYADGTTAVIELGIKHGKAAGAVVPHTVITDMAVGQTFEVGAILAWNKNYFERDRLNPNGVSMKGGVLTRVAFMEVPDTLEDGCTVSASLSERLGTPTSKMKTILVNFDQAVRFRAQVGDHVDYNSLLCTLEDSVLAGISDSDEALLGLSKLTSQSPKAKYEGVITGFEVVYYGALDDMDPTLREIVEADNKRRATQARRADRPMASTGEIKEVMFVGGEKVVPNTVALTFYMTHDLNAEIGDKVVFDNALKSIIGRVMTGTNRTEDGTPIDAVFAYQSVSNRILTSVESSGVTNSALMALGKKVVEIYKGS